MELGPWCQLPKWVMCQICRQRGWVGAHLGRSPVELGLGRLKWGARECRHTSDQSLYVRRGPQRTERHWDQLFLPAKTEGHSGIWDSVHPATAQIFKASVLGNCSSLQEVLFADLQNKQSGISICAPNISVRVQPHGSSLVLSHFSLILFLKSVCNLFQFCPFELFSWELLTAINKRSAYKPP